MKSIIYHYDENIDKIIEAHKKKKGFRNKNDTISDMIQEYAKDHGEW